MFPSLQKRQPLAFKLMAVLVLCVLLAPVVHALDAQHANAVDLTQQCEVCSWLLTTVFIVVPVFSFWALSPRLCSGFVLVLTSPVSSYQRPSGRSPPCC